MPMARARPLQCHRVCTGAGLQGVYRGRSAGCVQEQVLQGLRGCLKVVESTNHTYSHVSLQSTGCSSRPGSQLLSGREASRLLNISLVCNSAEESQV